MSVVITPDGAMARQRRTVAIFNPSEGGSRTYSNWDLVTDLSRPTEDAAFKRIAFKDYMIDFIKGGCHLGYLEIAIVNMERELIRKNYHDGIIAQIAARYKAPVGVIADTLNTISSKMTIREFLGLPPLPVTQIFTVSRHTPDIKRYTRRKSA